MTEEEITWHLETRRIQDLTPYFKNPRRLTKHQEKQLRLSLKKFGMVDHPSINLDNTIIGGHQRIKLLSKRMKEIEVMVPCRLLDEKEIEELNLRLNQNMGQFDYEILANEYEIEDVINAGFTEENLTGDFSPITIEENLEKNVMQEKCPECGQKLKKKK